MMKTIAPTLLILAICSGTLFAQNKPAVKKVNPIKSDSVQTLYFNQNNTSIIDNASLLEDVGYGYQKKSQITTSVSKVDTKDLHQNGYANIFDYLQGRVSGVTVMQSGPGNYHIMIRGINSFNSGTDPLVVLDGTPMSDLSVLLTVNPNDIKSVEVLKDAGAAAIYGVRGSNGVLVINTRH